MILKFADEARRRSFLAMVERERSDLAPRLHLTETLPHILAPDLSQEERDWVRDAIGP